MVTGDGTLGAAEDAPFDQILVTAGARDVARARWDQLAPGGRLVLPLRLCLRVRPDGAHLAELLVGRVAAWQDADGEDAEVTIEARRKNASAIQDDDGRGDALVVVDKLDHTFVVHAAPRTGAASA